MWPFMRGVFAWVGFIAVVVAAGAAIENGPKIHHAAKPLIEAWRAGEVAYYRAQANHYGWPRKSAKNKE
jgi:hypothetical protein